MKEKKYIAFFDNGHDYGEFVFYSTHRAKSKANIEDAKKEYASRHAKYRKIKITNIQLYEGE